MSVFPIKYMKNKILLTLVISLLLVKINLGCSGGHGVRETGEEFLRNPKNIEKMSHFKKMARLLQSSAHNEFIDPQYDVKHRCGFESK
jgi:hypothetical protein